MLTEDQDPSRAAAVLAKMSTNAAAALLASYPDEFAAKLVEQLPHKRAQDIVMAMEDLTGPGRPVPPPSSPSTDQADADVIQFERRTAE